MNNTTTQANGNSSSSDFIDFYQLLGADQEATTTALRRRINDLYTEAQSNRDHRNPTKRRRYEALCELLPYCRIVLLDPDKRVRYDRYCEQFQAGTTVPVFENMMDEIAGRIDDDLTNGKGEKVGLLGVEGDDDYLPVTPGGKPSETGQGSALRNTPMPREAHSADDAPRRSGLFDKPTSPRGTTPRATPVTDAPLYTPPTPQIAGNANLSNQVEGVPIPAARRGSSGGLTPVAYAVIALVIGTLTTRVLFKVQGFETPLLVGLVLAIVVYAIANALGNPSGPNRRNRV